MAKSDFSKNVLTLMSGTTIAQIISFAISPILSRIYSPEAFGAFGFLTSIIGVLVLFVGGRYEAAILIPKRDKDAINLFVFSVFLNLIISIFYFIGILVIFHCFDLTSKITNSSLSFFYLIPLLTFFLGCTQSINNWFNRKKMYKAIVIYRVTNSLVNSIGSTSIGTFGIKTNGLILSYFGTSILTIFIFYKRIKADVISNYSNISKQRMLYLAKKYKHFPLTNSFQALSDSFQINGIIYFISYFFELFYVGIFSFALRILMVPMNLVGGALSQVFYQQATEVYNTGGDIYSLTKKTIFKSLLLVIPVFFILLFFGPFLFEFIFGEQWRIAGEYARILSPWILLDFIKAPVSQIPIIIGKQNRMLFLSMVSNIIVLVTMLYAGVVVQNIEIGFYLLSIFQSLYIVFIILWVLKISKKIKL